MKPYYQNKWVTIYHGNCREILPQLDVKVDLVLTDPPYNAEDIGFNKHSYIGQSMKLPDGEYDQLCKDWFSLLDAKVIAITCGIANIWKYPPADWILCWDKPNSLSRNRWGGINAWEPILLYGKPANRLVKDIKRISAFSYGVSGNHPCPKPMELMDWLILLATNGEGLILDPFLGSGTTCFCAKKLNRYSIGIEIEEKYCEIAARRCSQEVMEFSKQ